MKKRIAFLSAALIGLAMIAAFPYSASAAPEKSVAAAPLDVTYYYLPG
jgi:hypothetical protein